MAISVIKRDGRRETLSIEKIQKQIRLACDSVPGVSPSMIEIAAQIQFYDGMETTMIDELLLKAMINLIDESEDNGVNNVNYQYVAGRQRIAMLRKEVYGDYNVPRLYNIIKDNVEAGVYTPDLLNWYSELEWDKIGSFINHDKDEKLAYAAVDQLIEKYLVRNRATNQVYETPQIRYAVAAATAFHMESGKDRLKYVRDYYNAASDGHFTLATPVLAGLGTKTKQFSSCVLISSDDTLDSIFATGEMVAKYASKRAGIGLESGKMRALGASIRGGEVAHTGLTPFYKKWFADLRSCSQGGIRNASATMYLPIWHYQFDDFIVYKNNQGTEENRVRHMDYGVQLNAFFWRRFKNDQDITFFDPVDVPDLYDAFHSDQKLFEELYVKYESKRSIRKKVLPASEVFNTILKERTDTGRIYLMYVDNVQRQTPFDVKTHPIVQSNLCTEILLPSKPFQRLDDAEGRIALCTLASMNWGVFNSPEEMQKACKLVVRALSNILGYQDFLSIQSKLANDEFEPLGIGITNLAYWHAKRGYAYGDPEALAEVKTWIEHQMYYLTRASVNLAKERGACTLSKTTWYGKGVFPWERRKKEVDELTSFEASSDLDWEGLRDDMLQYGIRNATLGAQAPVESSSVAINSTNGIALPMQLISVKESKAGSFVQVVPGYSKYKANYQKVLMWEQKDCIGYLKTAAVIQAYLDQSMSTDTFYSQKHFPNLKIPGTLIASNLMNGFRWGLKTQYYNLLDKQGAKDTNESAFEAISYEIEEEEQEHCSACVL